MNNVEFNKMLRPYNKEYRDLFGYVPCHASYICSHDEYFEALKKSIEEKKEIEQYISKRPPIDVTSGKRY